MKKKILIVSCASYSSGGKAKFTQLIYDYLKEYSGYNILLLNTERSKRTKKSKVSNAGYLHIFNNDLIRFFDIIINSVRHKFIFLKSLIFDRPDYVQIHTSSYWDFYDNSTYIMVAKIFRIKNILRVGGGGFSNFYNKGNFLSKCYVKLIFSSVDFLICQSEFWKSFFLENNLKKNNIIIIPNFVDFNYWQKSYGKKQTNEMNLLFIPGGDERVKGYYDLLPVFKEISEKTNITMTIVGLNKQIEDEYKYLVDNGKIKIIENISGEIKLEIFKKANIYILPSYLEGFPNTILEAMAAGLPIITTNIPSISAIVENEKNALLVTPGNKKEIKNAILRLYKDNQLCNRMSINNIVKCKQNFDISKIIGYFKTIYD
ncbi:glycosyltransferase [bacterium]|nr:MAG: glycosyltransferase [bacterium]